ncbi:hypothetical protein GCM10025880_44050 [Methylorubrum aminovorans]|nr:hypothetical protein GCM10025880_44050 [Methylorubrum aminovorans]
MIESLPFLAGGGEAARMIAERDWTDHPLGPPQTWPESLRTALSLILNSPESMILAWGPDLHFFFNDTYFPLLGPRLSWAMGERFDRVWADGWDQAKPIIDDAFAGKSRRFEDLPWKLATDRGEAETWWSFSYSRVLDGEGRVAGLFIFTNETTKRVRTEARQRESEAALRRSESFLTATLEGLPVGVIIADADGRIVRDNPANRELWGVPPETANWEGYGEWVGYWPETGQRLSAEEWGMARALLNGETVRGELVEIERFDGGGRRLFLNNAAPIRDRAGAIVGGVVAELDVTERVEVERRLRESEALARVNAERVQLALSAGAIVGTWLWDLTTDRFTVDEAFARAFGLDPALGREGLSLAQVVETVHPDDKAALAEAINAAIARGGAYAHQYRVRRADGRYYWIEANGRVDHGPDGTPLSFPGVLIDVEERRAVAEERDRAIVLLRRLNETLEEQVAARTAERDQIWQASSDLLAVADFEGRFVSLNPAWSATLGWSEAELKAVPFLDFIHPDDRERTREAAAALARGEMQLGFENRYRARDGGYRWFSWNTVPRQGLIYASVRDVTAIREQARALAEAEEALRQSQKMEAVGQLTGGLAHDFNNLLAGISGSLELMQTRIAQGRLKDVDRYMGAAQGAAKRAAALTHRLLAFSRRQTLDPRPTDVNRLVMGMEDLIRRTVGPTITIDVVGAAGLWPSLVDPPQLENALLNLCINARDAMPEGAHHHRDRQHVARSARRASARGNARPLSLAVRDRYRHRHEPGRPGQGVRPVLHDEAHRAGHRARTVDDLRLRQADRRAGADLLGGRPGHDGLHLSPRFHGEAESPDALGALVDAPRAERGETVLVVDDEPTVRMLVTEVLEDLGYTAIEAADSASGLQVLQSDVRIDLLISDVGLPGGMNGRQMADAARVTRPDLKVLFITGYAENAAVGNGQLEPGMAVLTKPFVVETLGLRIREIISRG